MSKLTDLNDDSDTLDNEPDNESTLDNESTSDSEPDKSDNESDTLDNESDNESDTLDNESYNESDTLDNESYNESDVLDKEADKLYNKLDKSDNKPDTLDSESDIESPVESDDNSTKPTKYKITGQNFTLEVELMPHAVKSLAYLNESRVKFADYCNTLPLIEDIDERTVVLAVNIINCCFLENFFAPICNKKIIKTEETINMKGGLYPIIRNSTHVLDDSYNFRVSEINSDVVYSRGSAFQTDLFINFSNCDVYKLWLQLKFWLYDKLAVVNWYMLWWKPATLEELHGVYKLAKEGLVCYDLKQHIESMDSHFKYRQCSWAHHRTSLQNQQRHAPDIIAAINLMRNNTKKMDLIYVNDDEDDVGLYIHNINVNYINNINDSCKNELEDVLTYCDPYGLIIEPDEKIRDAILRDCVELEPMVDSQDICFAGGIIERYYTGKQSTPSDIDIFIIGDDINRIVSQILTLLNPLMIVENSKTVYTLCVKGAKRNIQLIISDKYTPLEVIKCFDTEYCQIAYYNKQLIRTRVNKFAIDSRTSLYGEITSSARSYKAETRGYYILEGMGQYELSDKTMRQIDNKYYLVNKDTADDRDRYLFELIFEKELIDCETLLKKDLRRLRPNNTYRRDLYHTNVKPILGGLNTPRMDNQDITYYTKTILIGRYDNQILVQDNKLLLKFGLGSRFNYNTVTFMTKCKLDKFNPGDMIEIHVFGDTCREIIKTRKSSFC